MAIIKCSIVIPIICNVRLLTFVVVTRIEGVARTDLARESESTRVGQSESVDQPHF